MGDLDAATEHLERSCKMLVGQNAAAQALGVRSNVARVLATQGRQAESEALLRSLLDEARVLGGDAPIVDVLLTLMHLLADEERHDEVSALLAEFGEVLDAHPVGASQLPLLEARRFEAAGDAEAARAIYEECLRQAEQGGQKAAVMDMHLALRDVARAAGDFEGYVRHNEAHQQVRDEILGAEAARRFTAQAKHREMQDERAERAREREVLYGALPQEVADRLVRGEQVNDAYDVASVLFLDLAGFTSLSGRSTADEVVGLLASIFESCDEICRRHGLTKVKTIGDAYFAMALPTAGEPADAVVPRAAQAALEMMASIPEQEGIRARIGLDAGPVVAGVVGTDRLQWDVWGDTVNTASRMESTAEPGRIHVTDRIAEVLSRDGDGSRVRLVPRGDVEIKGKGTLRTFWLEPVGG
jgi:class 3 adenylate cyclase